MDIIKNTLNISIRHLRSSTIERICGACKIKQPAENELYVSLDDIDRHVNQDLMNDLKALVSFAKFMNCDAIHLCKQGKVLEFLTQYQSYKYDNGGEDHGIVELAYYGDGLMYRKNIE